MRKMAVTALVLVCWCGIPCASAAILPTVDDGDGMIGRDWYSNPNYYWVDSGAATVNASHDGDNRWWYRGLVIIDISSLAGTTPPGATFNFYSNGFSGVDLQYAGGTGSVLTTAYGQISGTTIATLGGGTGWTSYDVTSFVQSGIDNHEQYIGFVFNAVVNYGGGTLASSESGNGAYLDVIPEPGTLSLLALGSLVMIRRRK